MPKTWSRNVSDCIPGIMKLQGGVQGWRSLILSYTVVGSEWKEVILMLLLLLHLIPYQISGTTQNPSEHTPQKTRQCQFGLLMEIFVINTDLKNQFSQFKCFGSDFHCWFNLQVGKNVAVQILILQSIPRVCHLVLAKWLHTARDTSQHVYLMLLKGAQLTVSDYDSWAQSTFRYVQATPLVISENCLCL